MNVQKNCRFACMVLLVGSPLVGCDGPGPFQPTHAAAPPLAAVVPGHGEPGDHLPFRLDAEATLLSQEFAPDFGPPLFGRSEFDGRCSVPSDFVIGFGFVGQASHLGALSGVAEHCSQIDFTTGGSAITDGRALLTAADGDELRVHYAREVAQGGAPEMWTFVGGTGRFSSASGDATAHPLCNRETGTCVLTVEGVVVYGGLLAAGS